MCGSPLCVDMEIFYLKKTRLLVWALYSKIILVKEGVPAPPLPLRNLPLPPRKLCCIFLINVIYIYTNNKQLDYKVLIGEWAPHIFLKI